MFEEKLRLDSLYAFYGVLLTEKQREMMTMVCDLEYSLGEIAELQGISRQAVHDAVKRSERALEHYESVLGLLRRFSEKQAALEKIMALAETLRDLGIPEAEAIMRVAMEAMDI